MVIAPFGETLIEVDEPLADLGVLDVVPVEIEEDLLHLGVGRHPLRVIAFELRRGNGIALTRQVMEKRGPRGGLLIASFERASSVAVCWEAIDRGSIFGAEHELELPELARLKSARRFESR